MIYHLNMIISLNPIFMKIKLAILLLGENNEGGKVGRLKLKLMTFNFWEIYTLIVFVGIKNGYSYYMKHLKIFFFTILSKIHFRIARLTKILDRTVDPSVRHMNWNCFWPLVAKICNEGKKLKNKKMARFSRFFFWTLH